jgi:hypothetical protein
MVVLQSSPSMTLISSGSGSTILFKASSVTWKNTSVGKGVLQTTAFASSSTSDFLLFLMYSTMKPLKWFSILLTRDIYFLSVGTLVMHSFSIWLETTFEFVLRTHVWTPECS